MTRKSFTNIVLISGFILCLFGCNQQSSAGTQKKFDVDVLNYSGPKNVILFIGDGMGTQQVKAAGIYANGRQGTLSFEQFPYSGTVTTHSANDEITDSAAAATAMATGTKVNNGVVSIAKPGDKRELPTLLEFYKGQGKSVGLVTTVYITHATPACFGAHATSRNKHSDIAQDYLHRSQPNVLMGGGGHGMKVSRAKEVGYTVVTDRSEMKAIDTENITMLSGQFDDEIPYEYDGVDDMPHLSEMTDTALNILDNDPDGFFVMIEGGKIDWAGHKNKLERNIFETIEFANAVSTAVNWAKGRDGTLIVVTADHETGGLSVVKSNGKGKFPKVKWSTKGHTGVPVGIYAWGFGADSFTGQIDNTDIPGKIQGR